MAEIRPPVNFEQYKEWIKTATGYRWWVNEANKDHLRFRCEDCGMVIWWPKGDGAPDVLNCGYPCMGRIRPAPLFQAEEGR